MKAPPSVGCNHAFKVRVSGICAPKNWKEESTTYHDGDGQMM